MSAVDATHFVVREPGNGTLTVTGRTKTLNAALSGAGDVHLQGLVAENVTATVSGAGRLLVNATQTLDAAVSGAGAIGYRGTPAKLSTHVTGIGSIFPG